MAQLKDTTVSGDITVVGDADITGGIALDGAIHMNTNNSGRIYGVGTDGVVRDAFCPYDLADNLILGYGGYLDGVGSTIIYGNEVEFNATEGTTITSNVPFRNHMYMAYRGGSLSGRTNTTSYKPLGVNTMLADTSLGLFEAGNYTVDGTAYAGIKCNKDGMVLAWGYVYFTSLQAEDVVACCIYKNDTQYSGERIGSTKTTLSAFAPMRPFSVTAGDVLLLGCCNITAARGTATASASTLLGAMYIR